MINRKLEQELNRNRTRTGTQQENQNRKTRAGTQEQELNRKTRTGTQQELFVFVPSRRRPEEQVKIFLNIKIIIKIKKKVLETIPYNRVQDIKK